jgi:hypothetical protein
MFRALPLALAFVATLNAAPRLKDRTPAPDPEAARIEALKRKYDDLRRTAQPETRMYLAQCEQSALIFACRLDNLKAKQSEIVPSVEGELQKWIAVTPFAQDLYDIAVYDRSHRKPGPSK